MKGKTPAALLIVLLVVALGGYTVCRLPQTGTKLSPSVKGPGEHPDAGAWSPKSIPDEQLRKVVEDMIDRYDKLGALSVQLKTSLPDAAGLKGTTSGTGTYDLQRQDGTTRTRFRVFNTLNIEKEAGERWVTGESVIQLFDGEFLYLHFNQPKHQAVTKTFYDPARVFHIGGRHLFESLFDNNTVTLGTEETFGEWQTYVFNAKPQDGDWTAKYWFDKATGVQVQLVETKLNGAPQLTIAAEKVDTNPQFAPDRFKYEKPEGFELIDETAKQP